MATSDELRHTIRTAILCGREAQKHDGDMLAILDAVEPVVRAHSADVWDHGHRTANPVIPDAHRDVINPWKQP